MTGPTDYQNRQQVWLRDTLMQLSKLLPQGFYAEVPHSAWYSVEVKAWPGAWNGPFGITSLDRPQVAFMFYWNEVAKEWWGASHGSPPGLRFNLYPDLESLVVSLCAAYRLKGNT